MVRIALLLTVVLAIGGCGAINTAGQDPTPKPRLLLAGVRSWSSVMCGPCENWHPTGRPEVVHASILSSELVVRASRDTTTVLVVPYWTTALPGETWSDVTRVWRTVRGHELSRLSGGMLTTIAGYRIDAVTCPDCDQAIIVLGPDRARIRRLISSVRVMR